MLFTAVNLYIALVIMVAIQRLWEMRISARNEKKLKEEYRAVEKFPRHFIFMKLVHALWLVSCVGEAFYRQMPPQWWWIAVGLILLLAGQILRIVAIRTLDGRWTVKIIVIPESVPVAGGIYRYIRHPNYLGVIIEIVALPVIFGCWITAIVFSISNALVLLIRIRAEEQALQSVSEYKESLPDHRFIPGE
ncbi:isoprenylcysteine carboxyl methyltransferase family protein [Candidatus Uabimicrobium sp. HlEnr_7]|uniref:isoprenylcysteine carboxyl methyltransferase family protein n=1 Tax=Candidatus Uabimicrobium helgolandensis TaxID=3095367 RepID=UPI0035589114